MNLFKWGEVTASSDYMWSNCTDKELIIWEEPLLGSQQAQKFKLVAEGKTTWVSVKHTEPKELKRTPIIITSNHHLSKYCSAEKAAIEARCFTFAFNKSATRYPAYFRDREEAERQIQSNFDSSSRGSSGSTEDNRVHDENGSSDGYSTEQFGSGIPIRIEDTQHTATTSGTIPSTGLTSNIANFSILSSDGTSSGSWQDAQGSSKRILQCGGKRDKSNVGSNNNGRSSSRKRERIKRSNNARFAEHNNATTNSGDSGSKSSNRTDNRAHTVDTDPIYTDRDESRGHVFRRSGRQYSRKHISILQRRQRGTSSKETEDELDRRVHRRANRQSVRRHGKKRRHVRQDGSSQLESGIHVDHDIRRIEGFQIVQHNSQSQFSEVTESLERAPATDRGRNAPCSRSETDITEEDWRAFIRYAML